MKPRKIVAEILKERLPMFIIVNLVNENMRAAMSVVVIHHITYIMAAKPEVVQRDVEHLLQFCSSKGLFDVLQQQCGFTASFGPLDADEGVLPIDLIIEIAKEGRRSGREPTVEYLKKVGNLLFHGL